MVKKKLLTIEDLVQFCQQNNFARFSAKESGYQLAVQVPTTFEVEDNSDDDHRGMLRLKFRILHDGLNRNGSFVSHKAAEKASKTIADRPILAAIHKLDDGTYDFESHEMEIIENEDGEREINYIEKQVGSFSSEKPFWEHDDELDKDYLCAYGYIAEEYTKAADIIRNKGWTKNSCELNIEEMAYNAKDKCLELQSFYLSASTLLGAHNDGTKVEEGMLGSRADIADFSEKNNSIFSQNKQVIELLSALNEKIDNLNINETILKEGGTPVKKEFDENVEVTESEVEETSSETFEEEPKKKKKDVDDSVIVEDESDEDDDKDKDDDNKKDDDDKKDDDQPKDEDEPVVESQDESDNQEEESNSEEDNGEDDNSEDESYYSINYTVNVNGEKKDFAVSLKDKLYALTTLVNDTYSESDGAWYDVDVYEDTKTIVAHDYWNNKHFRQNYSVKKDVYSLKGDRTEVFTQYLSADEISKLDDMKANYSSTVEKLAKYESEPEKKQILESSDWDNIRETDEFAEISKEENHFDYSVDELSEKLDAMLLNYSKHNTVEFSAKEELKKSVGIKNFKNPADKKPAGKSRYGGIFNK
jgi:hypothetical protein